MVRFSSPRFNLSRKYFLNKQLVEPVDLPEWCWTHASFVGVARVHKTRQIGGPSGTVKTSHLLKSGSHWKSWQFLHSQSLQQFVAFDDINLAMLRHCVFAVPLPANKTWVQRHRTPLMVLLPSFLSGFVGVFFSERNDSKLVNIELFVTFAGFPSTLGCTLTNWQCLHERKCRKRWFKRSK